MSAPLLPPELLERCASVAAFGSDGPLALALAFVVGCDDSDPAHAVVVLNEVLLRLHEHCARETGDVTRADDATTVVTAYNQGKWLAQAAAVAADVAARMHEVAAAGLASERREATQ